MKRRVFILRFRTEGGIAYPEDPNLHRLVCLWAEANLSAPVNFAEYMACWAECSVDSSGVSVEVHGVVGAQTCVDFSLLRFTDNRSAKSLMERAEAWLHDQGLRGRQVMVRVGTNDEQMCPKWKEWLQAMKCVAAERWLFRIR